MIKKEQVLEEKVQKRYVELGGLVRNGEMVNKEKEERARQYVREQEKLIETLVQQERLRENSKYGELILQTNEVQFYVSTVVILKCSLPDKSYEDYLYEGAELGTLINLFNASSRDIENSYNIICKLREYNRQRNRLAHKMNSNRRLTFDECKKTIADGEEILKDLKGILKKISSLGDKLK